MSDSNTILSLNSGSSSLKFGIYSESNATVQVQFRGSIDGIGTPEGGLTIKDANGKLAIDKAQQTAKHGEAIASLVNAIEKLNIAKPAAVAHRIVHGGPKLREHQRITPQVLSELRAAETFAPLHVPVALDLIAAAEKHFTAATQFACFDTAFHRTLPEAAARLPIPGRYWQAGIRRYGFHGISCESILHDLGASVPARMVIAHLGNGASLTAVKNGVSVDTSMGLTPTGGIIMGTRTGDLDPGVVLHLIRTEGANAAALETLVDKQSGLLGISGISPDMRELHATANSREARLAIEMFSRTVRKAIGSYAAVLEGLDLLVFAGGIGEHDAEVRKAICSGLEFLGLFLDEAANAGHARLISKKSSRVQAMIIPTDEESQMARHALRLLSSTE